MKKISPAQIFTASLSILCILIILFLYQKERELNDHWHATYSGDKNGQRLMMFQDDDNDSVVNNVANFSINTTTTRKFYDFL